MDSGLLDDQLVKAKEELEAWKTKVKTLEEETIGRLMCDKLDEEDRKTEAYRDMMGKVEQQKKCQEEMAGELTAVQDEVTQLQTSKEDLLNKLKRCEDELEARKMEKNALQEKLKVCVDIPPSNVNFSGPCDVTSQQIRGVYSIFQNPSVRLQEGQALVTFEEERVASEILGLSTCKVFCEDLGVYVTPRVKRVAMEDPAVKFEIHLDVSKKAVNVSNIPPSLHPEQRLKERLELSFSKPSRGGGEVDSVRLDTATGTGQIDFLCSGVAEDLVLRKEFHVDLDPQAKVQVGPVHKAELCNFQMFSGAVKRTLLLDNIDDVGNEADIQDALEIHFQKSIHGGGEVDKLTYVGKNPLLARFSEDKKEE